MKKRVLFLLTLVVLMVFTTVVLAADKPPDPPGGKKECTTIQSGELLTSGGDVIVTGYDDWGYNYQAHLFNGWYHNNPRPTPAYTKDTIDQAPSQTWLTMKWNDAWFSNMDCDGDFKLDRHYGLDSYIGSGAWITNHQFGEYPGDDGKICKWTYFVKIITPPADAYTFEGVWYHADSVEIGPAIWGAFAIIQEFDNDPCAGGHILYYHSPDRAGLGNW